MVSNEDAGKKAKGFSFPGLLPAVHSIGLARTNRLTERCVTVMWIAALSCVISAL